MKICFITNLFAPYSRGGAETYVEAIAAELAKDNEVIVVCTKPFSGFNSLRPSNEPYRNMKVYSFSPINVYSLRYPPKPHQIWTKALWHIIDIWNPHTYIIIKRILRKEKPDIVHTMNLTGLSTSAITAVASCHCVHFHSLLDGALLSPWADLLRNGEMIKFNFFDRQYLKIKSFICRPISAVLSQSQFLLDMHIRNGYFRCTPCYITRGFNRLNYGGYKPKIYSPFNLLYVGAISQGKGAFVLLNAFKQLGRNDVQLNFVGIGTNADLETLAKQSSNLENVYFHGFKDGLDLAKMFEQANITVIPSVVYDNFPAVMIESLSFGTPVVASRIGGIPEAVIDGYNGRLFEAGDSLALKNVLEDLINSPDKLRVMEHEALKSAENYNFEKNVAYISEIYRNHSRAL